MYYQKNIRINRLKVKQYSNTKITTLVHAYVLTHVNSNAVTFVCALV